MLIKHQRRLFFSFLAALGLAMSLAIPGLATSEVSISTGAIPALATSDSETSALASGHESNRDKIAEWRDRRHPASPHLAQSNNTSAETAPSRTAPSGTAPSGTTAQQIQQGQTFYEAGQYLEAIATWQQLLSQYQGENDPLAQARILSQLALAYQALGQWDRAKQSMAASLQQLSTNRNSDLSDLDRSARAQILNNQGNFQLQRGEFEAALTTWQQAETLYQQLGNPIAVVQTQLNQAEALYDLGFYQQAVSLLTTTKETFNDLPFSELEIVTFRRLGDLLRMVGQLEEAEQALTTSRLVAEGLQRPEEIGKTLISLGHTARAQNELTEAEAYYQQAANLPLQAETALRNQLAQLSLWASTASFDRALRQWPAILDQLDQLPASHTSIYSRIQLVQSLTKLKTQTTKGPEAATLAPVLTEAVRQAQAIGDRRAEAYALGSLGGLYEQTQQWESATDLTHRALSISQTLGAAELMYPWQWQMGRILKRQGQTEKAIEAYREAVNHLKMLRGDLAAVNSDIQFSFQESVEPIYRELVGLLLKPDSNQHVSQANLESARDTIESLQLAELDDYFKEACLDVQSVQIDDIDPQAAIFYPILLGDRLDVILRLPGQPLAHYTTAVNQAEVETLADQLRQTLVIRSRRDYLPLSQQLYNWLIRPISNELQNSGVDTLVFVLDRPFQNVPMATLHNGQHFLIEDYSVALTPGLKLISPQPIPRSNLKILAAGLSEGRQGFAPLSYVNEEIKAIESVISQGEVLLNQAFTRESLVDELQTSTFPIVHIATHGQFSSTAENTFLLSWDNRINVTELDQALQSSSFNRETAIELLVLSACQTAAGDKRATLGLAGTAVKAGARSTVATLWSVNDEATANLVGQFYQLLTQPDTTKADALRQAQLKLLQDPLYRHPVYWAPYILLGNWL